MPQTRASGTDTIVQSRLMATGGEPIRIDYVMRGGPGGWRVVDVLLDGSISRVAVQRSDFRALLASGDPNPLINSLRQKITDLSGGAMRS
jgi:phospholipid transport system substrate-binding protein